MKPTILISLLMALSGKTQAVEFQNLNFDAPNTNNLTTTHYFPGQTPFPIGTVADLLPGWNIDLDHKAYSGPVEYFHESENVPSLFYANNEDLFLQRFFVVYSPAGTPGRPYDISLWQVGRIPDGAINLITVASPVFIYINGKALDIPEHWPFGPLLWDVRSFAGQEVKLEARNYYEGGSHATLLFEITGFTTPEPSEWALLITGGTVLCLASRCGARWASKS